MSEYGYLTARYIGLRHHAFLERSTLAGGTGANVETRILAWIDRPCWARVRQQRPLAAGKSDSSSHRFLLRDGYPFWFCACAGRRLRRALGRCDGRGLVL